MNELPLQIAGWVIFEITGVGLTVTITEKLLPEHEPDEGETVYVAFNVAFVELTNVPEMLFKTFVPVAMPEVVKPTSKVGAPQV